MQFLAGVFLLIGAVVAMYVFIAGHWKSGDFWGRQFNSEVTRGQVAFDVALGIIMPILCLIFDPMVFRNQAALDHGFHKPFEVFGDTSIALGIVALSLWLLLSRYLNRASAFLAGIFFYGAFFALLLGILILPLSVIGLLGLIGVLGFTPFFTSFVFLRNGVRAYRRATEHSEMNWSVRMSFVSGMILIIVIPILVQTMNFFPS